MKAETFISLLVLITIGLAIGVFYNAYAPVKSSNITEPMQTENPPSNFTPDYIPDYTTLVSIGDNVCEGCHFSGKSSIPQAYEVRQHKEGGAYCLKCHSIDHKVHPINDNVTCERCHGSSNAQIPAFNNGTIVCVECHGFPDPLKPSNGSLVAIHRPRDIDCVRCHVGSSDSCLKCHNEIKSNEKWDKRLNHFRTLLNAYPQKYK